VMTHNGLPPQIRHPKARACRVCKSLSTAPATSYNYDTELHDAFSIQDFLGLAARIGSRPWISIPVTLDDSEYTALSETLASLQATYNFPELLIEFGDGDATGPCGNGPCRATQFRDETGVPA
jgi:hypothetical protein